MDPLLVKQSVCVHESMLHRCSYELASINWLNRPFSGSYESFTVWASKASKDEIMPKWS
jgi:hypothetical protein